ncbi:MAG: hypothetical protein HFI39_07180 [Lachnospiraceae bacterium]|nr:hypothetical protein [Lachnospiraceae bacterium]
MKRFAIVLSAIAVFVVSTTLYYFSYQLSAARREALPPVAEATAEETTAEPQTNAMPVNENQEIYINSRMDYRLQLYDARSSEMTEQQEKVPVAMYGLTPEDLKEYLKNLSDIENQGNEEEEVRYELVSFSQDGFTVRKTVSEKEPVYELFLIAEDGHLTAYTGDRMHVYEYTMIPLSDFPLEQQAMLTKGVFIKTLADYYDFLETYSS